MHRYDVPTAVTFLFAGLGLGTILAILVSPRPRGGRWRKGLAPEQPFGEFDEEEVFVGPAV
jgi:hypothetical protein